MRPATIDSIWVCMLPFDDIDFASPCLLLLRLPPPSTTPVAAVHAYTAAYSVAVACLFGRCCLPILSLVPAYYVAVACLFCRCCLPILSLFPAYSVAVACPCLYRCCLPILSLLPAYSVAVACPCLYRCCAERVDQCFSFFHGLSTCTMATQS